MLIYKIRTIFVQKEKSKSKSKMCEIYNLTHKQKGFYFFSINEVQFLIISKQILSSSLHQSRGGNHATQRYKRTTEQNKTQTFITVINPQFLCVEWNKLGNFDCLIPPFLTCLVLTKRDLFILQLMKGCSKEIPLHTDTQKNGNNLFLIWKQSALTDRTACATVG